MKTAKFSMTGGGTMLEVMVACVVIMTLAITGAAYMARSSGTLAISRNRAVAVAMAESQMDALRSRSYSSLTQQMNGATIILATNNTSSKLEFWPAPELVAAGLGTGREAIKMTVQVSDRATDFVTLTTIYSP